ncbi:rhodanese-like domain-containing protein [Ferviditalea candida]|uniref:Rhodanese-like domain-containing protein n=1 Tax=Ferviditalea candida TaxID=3108399 RepID=A0ABU5ZHR2_9BACL|nr:rhodanese-like domain-containing protein [Paenibacillaceae bacterium T2]
MFLRYFYNEKLAHASYMFGCQAVGEAIVVDPSRDVEPYLKVAKAEGLKIVGTLETHLHADFVSGAREMADRVNSTLYISGEGGEGWRHEYVGDLNHRFLKDGETFKIGNLTIQAMHTPGHTPDSMSFILTDGAAADRPIGIFTGDFVFVGDVGRPDLGDRAVGLVGTADMLARLQYKSLQRFKELPDYLQVWPAHGAGSACGKALGAIPSSTVGYERLFNPALSYTDEDAFVEFLLDGQPEPPKYFSRMNPTNKKGPALMKDVRKPEANLSYQALLDAKAENGAMLVDTRSADQFSKGHIPGTINIPLNKSFTNWAGWLVDYERPLYLLIGQGRVDEAALDLYSIGIDNYAGYAELAALQQYEENGGALQTYQTTRPSEIAEKVLNGEVHVVDVRNDSERKEGYIPSSQHIMLGYLSDRYMEIPTDKPILVQCRSGARSAIAASILQAKGITNVINLLGGYDEWSKQGLPKEVMTAVV